MRKQEYSVEDFVLDPEFRKWVESPDRLSKSYWENYLKENPSKVQEVKLARKILLNMARNTMEIPENRVEGTWKNIDHAVDRMEKEVDDKKVIPLSSYSTIKRQETDIRPYSKNHQIYRMVGILALTLMLAFLANTFLHQEVTQPEPAQLVYEEHYAPPGVKSNLTLQDGSKVTLNSGSTLRYVKNFEADQRVLELEGEAYFEVAKDKNRPFMVKTGSVTTKALGTSFTIKAYENEALDIALLTGLVEVDLDLQQPQKINLVPGEALNIHMEEQEVKKQSFDKEKLMAWTKKTIIFDRTPIDELTRVLENWYGVEIVFANQPKKDLAVSGRFHDQTLENVLEGLSYSARFAFEIQKNQVTITFKTADAYVKCF